MFVLYPGGGQMKHAGGLYVHMSGAEHGRIRDAVIDAGAMGKHLVWPTVFVDFVFCIG